MMKKGFGLGLVTVIVVLSLLSTPWGVFIGKVDDPIAKIRQTERKRNNKGPK